MADKNPAPAARKPVLIALSDYENALESFPSENDPRTDRSTPRQPPPPDPGLDFFRSEKSPADAAPPIKARAAARKPGVGWIAWIGAACGAIVLSFWAGQLLIPSLMWRLDTAKDRQTQVARAPTPPEAPSPSPEPAAPPAQSGSPLPDTSQPPALPPAEQTPATRQPATKAPAAPAPTAMPAPARPAAPARSAPAPSPSVVIRPPGRVEVPTMRLTPPAAPPTTVPAASSAPATSGAAASAEPRTATPSVASTPEVAPAAPPRASAPATTGPATAAPLPPPPADARAGNAPAPAPAPVVTDEMAVSTTLERYRAAYSQLNAAGAKAVWPTVDLRTLAKAFDQLESQDIVFTGCQVRVAGDRANALCNGNAAFVPKVGANTPRIAYRQWNFDLRRAGERWVISAVDVR